MKPLNRLSDTVLVDVKCAGGDVATSPQCMDAIAKGKQGLDEHGNPQGDRDAEMFAAYSMGKSCPVLPHRVDRLTKPSFCPAMYTNAVQWFRYKPAERGA